MTDEEIDKMADDFVNAQEFTKVYGIARKAECGAFWKSGFLAGLKAGRPQWHDLRENPNDLPEGMGLGSEEVYVAYKDGVTDFACYRFDKKYWERSENEELAENVIGWCEIPTFDKE